MSTLKYELTKDELALKAQLEAKHGPVYLIKAGGLVGWFKEPTEPEIDCFMFEQMDDKLKSKALTGLMRSKLVYPEGGAKEFFKPKPGAIVPFAGAYGEAVGLTEDAYLGK